jgi:hypothetical protein
MRRLLLLSTALAGLLVLLTACSGEGGDAAGATASTTVKLGTELRVQDLPAAVAAVEADLGGPQRYAEINLTTGGVNLFVASSDTEELAYYYD